MSLSGNLEDVSVADALQFIHLGGRTGTQTVLLDALRIFDERNRDASLKPPTQPVMRNAPTPAHGVSKVAAAPTPAHGTAPVAIDSLERLRFQVVSSDKQIAEKLAQALP